MTRHVFPSDRAVIAARSGAGTPLRNAAGAQVALFTDEALTQPADLLTLDGEPIPGGIVTVEDLSTWPRFQGPDGAVDLWTEFGHRLAAEDSIPAQVAAAVDALLDQAPGALDTLRELADQLAADESAASALTVAVAGKADAAATTAALATKPTKSAAETITGQWAFELSPTGITGLGASIGDVTIASDTDGNGSGDVIIKQGATERARWKAGKLGIGTPSPSRALHIVTPAGSSAVTIDTGKQAMIITQTTDLTGQAPVDCIDIDYSSSGDGIFVVNRGGDPTGYTGSTGGKANFNAFIPRFRDYDANAGNLYNGTVQANEGLVGVTVINQANTAKSRAAYFCSYGNLYAVKIDNQINGGVPTTDPKGTGGAFYAEDYSTASGMVLRKKAVPSSTGDVITGALPEAILYMMADAGASIRAMQVYDKSANGGAGQFGYVLTSDGQASVATSMRVGSANTFAQINSLLHAEKALLDVASGFWQAAYIAPSFRPTNDIAKSIYGVTGQVTVLDDLATGTLSGTIVGGRFAVVGSNGTRQVSQARGMSAAVTANGAGTFALASAVHGAVGTTNGQVTEGRALDAGAPSISAGKLMPTTKGLRVANQGATGVTNAYGVHIEAQSGASGVNRSLYIAGGDAELVGGVNIVLGTATGTKIGTASTQLLGFYGATPVTRRTVSAAATDAASSQTLVNSLRQALIDLGVAA